METFNFHMPTRLWVGHGETNTIKHFDIDARHVIIVTSDKTYTNNKDLLHRIMKHLETLSIGYSVFDTFSVPLKKEDIFRGTRLAEEKRADAVIAIGGGRVLDLGKMIARFAHEENDTLDAWMFSKTVPPLNTEGLSLIAVPTSLNNASAFNPKAFLHDAANERRVRFKHESLFPARAIMDIASLESLDLISKESAMSELLVRSIELLIDPISIHHYTMAKSALEYLLKGTLESDNASLAYASFLINTLYLPKPKFPLHQMNDAIEGAHPNLPFAGFLKVAVVPYLEYRLEKLSDNAQSTIQSVLNDSPYASNNVYVALKDWLADINQTELDLHRYQCEASMISDYTVHLKTIYPDFVALDDTALYAIMEAALIR